MSWEGDDINLDIITDYNGHAFGPTRPYDIMSFLWNALDYGELQDAGDDVPGSYTTFDQKEFYPSSIDWNSNANFQTRENGYVYIPTTCQGSASVDCRLHFYLHGCNGRAPTYKKSNYNRLAETNKIIMVYPDTRCWDQHGDIDPTGFKTKDGIVQTALRDMINRLTAEPEDDSNIPDTQCDDY